MEYQNLTEIIQEAISAELLEFKRKNMNLVINGKEIPFGSPLHVSDLQNTLSGMERVRDCYSKGSGHRLVFATACGRLRKLIQSLSNDNQTEQSSGVI